MFGARVVSWYVLMIRGAEAGDAELFGGCDAWEWNREMAGTVEGEWKVRGARLGFLFFRFLSGLG